MRGFGRASEATRGALAGGLGALPVVLADFVMGAGSVMGHRGMLALRLLLLLVPLGALAGGSLALFAGWAERRRAPLRAYVGLSAAPLMAVAWLLFTGGSARRLPLRYAGVAMAAVVLLSMAALTVFALRWVAGRKRSARRLAAAGLVIVATGLLVADRLVLPGLYAYLHSLLGFVAWGGFFLAARWTPPLRWAPPAAVASWRALAPLALGLIAVLALNVATLDQDQTVHLAVLSPRAPSSRGVLQVLGPLRAAAPRAHADSIANARREQLRRARARRLSASQTEGLTFEGAHILLVTIDALRADHLGLYGYRQRPVSPTLDRLAAESIVFEQASAPAPHSSYSISSLMTSSYVLQRVQRGLEVPSATLAGELDEVGYHSTALYTEGIFHTGGERLSALRDGGFGFRHRSHGEHGAEIKTDEVLAEMDTVAAAGEPPSVFWVHYFDVHEPYRDTTYGTSDIERYDSEIRAVDRALERLLEGVEARLQRPVILAVTADHGEEFRDHGGVFHGSTVYQEQVRVPLLVRLPSRVARRVAIPVETIDLTPTLLGLVGLPPAPSMEGDDLRPLMTGDALDLGPAFATAGSRHMAVRWPHKLVLDVRYGTYELFDLGADPTERDNLADELPLVVEALDAEVRAWLDGLAEGVDPYLVALHQGRADDRSAVPVLLRLLGDRDADPALRAEAAESLGALCPTPPEELAVALHDPHAEVASAAAIALGHLRDDRASAPLRLLASQVSENDPRWVRIAISRGWLGDRDAVPGLLEAVDESHPYRVRRDAVHLLGSLADPRAVSALLELLDDQRLRRRAAIALGRIGDARALEPLREQLETNTQSSVRDAIARAFGQLGDRNAIPTLIALASEEGLPSASESLVRLGAVGREVGGADLGPEPSREGFEQCRARDSDDEWRYIGQTTCQTAQAEVRIPLSVPSALSERADLRMRVRRVDQGHASPVALLVDGEPRADLEVDGEWSEIRLSVTVREAVSLRLPPEVVLEVDHVLLLPPSSDPLADAS